MTDAQEKAFSQVEEILREHFSAAVLVVEGEVANDDNRSDIRSSWHGGYATSLGLLEIGQLQAWHKQEDASA